MSGAHSNGKGSKRRPAAISEEQLAANWDAIFGSRKPAPQQPRKPDLGRVLVEDYGTKTEWVMPPLAEILGDNQSST